VQPDGTFQAVTGDCTADPGCNDWFEITCSAGDVLDLTFCANGGSSPFDTGLSVWTTGAVQEDCNDDFCGLQSELSFVFPDSNPHWVRIGGFGGDASPYTLAYQAPAGCIITGAPVPTVNEIGLLVLTLLLALAGGTALFRRRLAA
jgi:hypothetical protein